jgi:hypothetical protein
MDRSRKYRFFQDRVLFVVRRISPMVIRLVTNTTVLTGSGKQSLLDDWNSVLSRLNDAVSRERGMVPRPTDVQRKIDKTLKVKRPNPLLQEFLSYVVN